MRVFEAEWGRLHDESVISLAGSCQMSLKKYWAYDFTCDEQLEGILAVFNEVGPWTWYLGDSAWYGDYLNTRPMERVRVRVHEFPGQGYSGLLEIEPGSFAEKGEVDQVFRDLLAKVNAQHITEIEPYD